LLTAYALAPCIPGSGVADVASQQRWPAPRLSNVSTLGVFREHPCAKARCDEALAVRDGGVCCDGGVCRVIGTRTDLLYSQINCLLRRYDALATATLQLGAGRTDVQDVQDTGHLRAVEAARRHAVEVDQQLRDFWQNGFLVLRSALSRDLVETVRFRFDDVVWDSDRLRRPGALVEITRAGAFSANKTLTLRSAPGSVRARTYRISGLEIGADEPKAGPWNRVLYHPRIMEAVMRILGAPPRLLQSLTFERGSQQTLHDDMWYLPAGPDDKAGIVGVWAALEDSDEANGALMYVPGSHARPERVLHAAGSSRRERLALPQRSETPQAVQDKTYREALEDVRLAGLSSRFFHARAGDVAIWHERLLHGGGPISDWSRTRLSIVSHYAAFG